MTSKEIVKKAVEMKSPEMVPLLFFNKDLEKSDIALAGYREAKDFELKGTNRSEWGFDWERQDDTMGQPKHPPITSWDKLEGYKVPDPNASGRFEHMPEYMEKNRDRYVIGCLGLSGFNFVTFIRGFENTLEDLYLDRENIEKLIDMVFDFEMQIIKSFSKYGVDAIGFGDDWGTQNCLMISPGLWREVFKPRYKEQFDLVHKLGMHVYFHCCGNIYDIIPDFIEIGVDILNLNQPDLFGIEKLGSNFGGRVCFNCPVDHQTVAIKGIRNEIFDYVKRLNEHLGRFSGGFIGYIEEYHSIGMSEENYKAITEAFESLNNVSGD
jgi:uroporphyrinogen decarboxylase